MSRRLLASTLIFTGLGLVAAPCAFSADAPPPAHDEGTLEVTADHDLEWLQQDHAYVARGNAVAKRGGVTLMGDLLIAY